MSEDSTITTLSLPNGVKLTWPSNLGQLELCGSVHTLSFFIDRHKPVSIGDGYLQGIDLITFSISKGDGLSQALDKSSIGGGCGCT